MKGARWSILKGMINPVTWFRQVRFQSIGINQPPDMLENGMACMCESCPDACVWKGNLVSSCRLDEYRRFGKLMSAVVHDGEREGRKEALSWTGHDEAGGERTRNSNSPGLFEARRGRWRP